MLGRLVFDFCGVITILAGSDIPSWSRQTAGLATKYFSNLSFTQHNAMILPIMAGSCSFTASTLFKFSSSIFKRAQSTTFEITTDVLLASNGTTAVDLFLGSALINYVSSQIAVSTSFKYHNDIWRNSFLMCFLRPNQAKMMDFSH